MEALHQPGDIIAQRYRIIDTLGQGGVGITYATEDVKSGQQVALKVLSLRQMGDWKVLELFEREAKVLAQLNHPAIPRYLDYFQVDTAEDRAFYIVQQLAEGKSLADLVKNGWRMNESGVRRIATQILEILVYLHDLKPPVIHRDIKPQNLIAGQNAKIFLVDFGAVQDTYRSTFAKGSTIIGTYGYMAPEQFLGQAVPATDLYALGATVLFLLTHRSPADLPTERLKISFRSRIQISEGFADWLEKMLEPDAEDRFPSAKEALEALKGLREQVIVTKSKSRPSVPWKALVGAGVATIAAVITLNSFKWTILGALGFRPSGICDAAYKGNIDVVRNYLKQGGNPLTSENGMPDGMTVLDCWSWPGEEVRELLIAKATNVADVNARYYENKTLLHYAAVLSRKDITELLIARGADINAKDNGGNTPLHNVRSKEVAQLLIAKGADVNATNYQGNIALHYVAGNYTCSQELAQLLITKGADVNATNNEGDTPLHLAAGAYRGSTEMVAMLIAKGADINATNNNGTTPLHRAAGVGSKEVVAMLIAQGADVNAKNSDGTTPLDLATWNCPECMMSRPRTTRAIPHSTLQPKQAQRRW